MVTGLFTLAKTTSYITLPKDPSLGSICPSSNHSFILLPFYSKTPPKSSLFSLSPLLPLPFSRHISSISLTNSLLHKNQSCQRPSMTSTLPIPMDESQSSSSSLSAASGKANDSLLLKTLSSLNLHGRHMSWFASYFSGYSFLLSFVSFPLPLEHFSVS